MKKIYVAMSDKSYESSFIKSIRRRFKGDLEIIQLNIKSMIMEKSSFLITDNLEINFDNTILMTDNKEGSGIYKYQAVSEIYLQITKKINELQNIDKSTKIISFLNINFQIGRNKFVENLINAMKEKDKILSINLNEILSSVEIAEKSTIRDLYFFEKIGVGLNLDDIVIKSNGFDYLNGYQSFDLKENEYSLVISKLSKILHKSKYDYTFIDTNFIPSEHILSILKQSNIIFLFYSNDFDYEYVNSILKYFKENNYSNTQTIIFSIGQKTPKNKESIHLYSLNEIHKIEEIIEIIRR